MKIRVMGVSPSSPELYYTMQGKGCHPVGAPRWPKDGGLLSFQTLPTVWVSPSVHAGVRGGRVDIDSEARKSCSCRIERHRVAPSMMSVARSASAAIVFDGFRPMGRGTMAPSRT